MQARNNNIVYALSAVAFLILFNIIDRAPIFHSPLFVNSCARVVFVFSIATQFSIKKKKLQTRKVWTTFSKQTRLRRPRRHRNSPIKTNRTISSPRVRLFAPLNTHCTSFLFSNSLPSYSSIFVFNHLRTCPLSIAQAKRTDLFPRHHPLPRMLKCNRYRATKILLEKT